MTRIKGKARVKDNKKKANKKKNDFFLRKKNLIGKILKYDDPFLAEKCDIVPEGEDVKGIFKNMIQVLNATENGVGLAASQIGESRNMIVIKPDSDSTKITCMINPKITSTSDKKKLGREGCLSYPKTFALIERFTSVKVSYYNADWEKCSVEYKEGNILGIIVQHEIEHLTEGHCQVYEWWKDPEGKKKELEEKFKPPQEESEEETEVQQSEEQINGTTVI